MGLTKKQRKQIRQKIRNLSLEKTASELNLRPDEIKSYLKKIWRKEKYQKFLARQKNQEKQISPLILRIDFNFKKWFKQNWKILLFLTFLVFIVYFNSLNNEFVSDDIPAIKNNSQINQISYFWKQPYFNTSPKQIIIFFTHKIFGLKPLFYRLPNILFHLGLVWLIYLLIGFFFKPPIPLFTASIFGVHPVLIESIVWISAGHYSLATFFALFSFLAYLIYFINIKKTKFYYFSILLFFLALLSNEKLVILPIILFLYEFCFGNLKNNWRKLIPFFILGGIWILFLVSLVGGRISSLETAYYQEPGLANPLIQIPVAISSYLELIFWPKNLTLYHSEMIFSQNEYFLRLSIFILFLATITYFFKKNRRIFFWLLFFPIALLPTLTPLGISWIVAERYVYLGALGIFVLLALIIQKIGKISKNQKVSYIVFALVLLCFSIRTITRNADWKNQDTLWLAAAKTSPSSPQNHNNLGDYYGRQGNLKRAVEEFKIAIQLNPNYGDAYHNLANTYQQMGETDKAIENYQTALSFNPNLWQSHQSLGTIYFIIQEEFELAKQEFEKAIKINPQNSNLFSNLGIIYLKLEKEEKAKESFSKVLQIDPQNERAKQELLLLE